MPYAGRAQVLIAWATEPFATPTWTDVTNWVRLDKGISTQRGRQDNISQISHGNLTHTADNSDGRFTVGRSSSPWAPNVKIGRRIQVNIPDEHGTLHTRFDGLITELPTQWEGGPGIESLTVIQAADILAWLARQPQLLSWTQQEMLLDAPLALYSLADASNVTQATDQAGQGAAPLQVISQGDGTGAAAAGSGVPLTEVQTSNVVAQQQVTTVFTFTKPGPFTWQAPLGTLISCDVANVAGGQAGATGTGAHGGTGGKGAEYAEEPALAVTPGNIYSGSVGAAGVPPAGSGGDTTFTGDSVTVTAHAAGSGSTNTDHHNGGTGATGGVSGTFAGGGGGSSGGQLQAGNNGVFAAAGGAAVTGGGAGGAGDSAGAGGAPGAQPGGGGGGGQGGSVAAAGGAGGVGQVTITYTYIPIASSQQNSGTPAWLFTPSATLGARILSGPLPQPVTAAAGFAAEVWASFAAFPAAAVSTFTTPGAVSWTAPPGITAPDVACVAGGQAGATGTGAHGGNGGNGGEEAEEPALAVTPNNTYSGTVGAAGAPSAGAGGNTTFTGDTTTVIAHASGSGSANAVHNNGGTAGTGLPSGSFPGGGGGSSGGSFQAGNNGVNGAGGGNAVTGGGAGGAGDTSGVGGAPGAAPGGGGGGGAGGGTPAQGASGAPGQITITSQPSVSTLLTLTNPRGQTAIAVWVTSGSHLQLASTSNYGTRMPTWTTVDAGQVPNGPFHVFVDVAATTGVATLYVNNVSAGTLTLPAGASYTWLTIGGAYGAWLGGWNGSAGLAAVYPAPLSTTRIGVHYTAGSTGFIGSSTGTMIAKIASYVGLPSFYYTPPSGTTDPSYGLTKVSYYDLRGQQPLSQMQLYEQAEGGVLSVNAAGMLTFADRASRYAAGSAAQPAFVLTAGQYEPDTHYKSNDQYLCTAANYATQQIPGGYPVSSAASKLDFGAYTANAGSLSSPQVAPFSDATASANVYSSDDIMDAGNWQTGVFGQPVSRVPSLTIDLLTLPPSQFSIASFYATDIGSALQLAGLPSQAPDNTGQVLSAYQVIEGINETIDLGKHDVQLYTSPLAQSAAWIPGDPLLGVLGSTNTVGRSQAPAALGAPYGAPPTFGATLNRTGSVGAQDLRALTVNTQNRLTPPLVIAQQQNAQTLTVLAGQPVTFDTLLADTAGGFKTLTTYTVQPGFAGYYLCSAVVQAATGITNLGGLAAWFAAVLGGTASQWGAQAIPYLSTAPYTAIAVTQRIGPCNPGDTIQVVAAANYTTPPASVPLGTADGGSMFTLLWQGD